MKNQTNNFENNANFKSGFITIVGAPNVGKSTLLNKMIGEKIAITSQKPQTTRNRILGILHKPCSQLIFIDTPGVHKTAKSLLNTRIVDTALSAMDNMDAILIVIDVLKSDADSKQILLEKLKKIKKPVILAINKIDLIKKTLLLDIIDVWSKTYSFSHIIPISAKLGLQVDKLVNAIESVLHEGPRFFPDDTLTDMPERFIAAEMIREKVFRFTGQEIPYSIAVSVDSFSEYKKGSLVKIYASIHVEHDSQKGIIIGKNGDKLKQIGTQARIEIEKMTNAKVFLKLFVRVQKNWSKDTKALKRFGY